MNQYLPYIFAGNFLLVIIDASIGYHVAPILIRSLTMDSESGSTVGGVRMLLAGVVTLSCSSPTWHSSPVICSFSSS